MVCRPTNILSFACNSELRDLGIRDYQVPALLSEHLDESLAVENVDGDTILSALQWVYHVVHLLLLLSLAAFPMLLLNLPVGILAGLWSESRRKKALAASKVKIRGYDVRSIWSAFLLLYLLTIYSIDTLTGDVE